MLTHRTAIKPFDVSRCVEASPVPPPCMRFVLHGTAQDTCDGPRPSGEFWRPALLPLSPRCRATATPALDAQGLQRANVLRAFLPLFVYVVWWWKGFDEYRGETRRPGAKLLQPPPSSPPSLVEVSQSGKQRHHIQSPPTKAKHLPTNPPRHNTVLQIQVIGLEPTGLKQERA
jgi:hypothetical protein